MGLRPRTSPPEGFEAYLAEQQGILLRLPGRSDRVPASLEELHPGTSLAVRLAADLLPPAPDVRAGQLVEVWFARENDATYAFTTPVVEPRPDPTLGLRLAWPVRIDRHQARRHVRLPILLDVEYAGAGPRRLGDASGWRRAVGLDVSGSGLGVVTDETVELGRLVLVRCTVPGRNAPVHVDARARVVRCSDARPSTTVGGRAGEKLRCGLEFVDLPARLEQDLVSSVFFHLTKTRLVP